MQLISRTGGLVCPKLLGSGLTRVTPSYIAWGNTEPNGPGREFCACTGPTSWYDVLCGQKIPFLCSGKRLIC